MLPAVSGVAWARTVAVRGVMARPMPAPLSTSPGASSQIGPAEPKWWTNAQRARSPRPWSALTKTRSRPKRMVSAGARSDVAR